MIFFCNFNVFTFKTTDFAFYTILIIDFANQIQNVFKLIDTFTYNQRICKCIEKIVHLKIKSLSCLESERQILNIN